MGEKITGTQSGISISKEDSYGEKVAKSVPLAGGLMKLGGSAVGALSDNQVTTDEVGSLAADSTSFIQSCTDAASGIATDPIGWLIGQGLSFLLNLIQPLQDAIHVVSGDGPALGNAAGNFSSIATGLEKFATTYQQDAADSLKDWHGAAADAAAAKTADFADGVLGIAGEAGNISQLLQISSMVMTVIEEFIKALLTELITWLIMIWIPALAAAIPTFGASTVEAGAVSAVRGVQTGTKATKQVSRLQQLLNKIKDLLAHLKDFMKRAGEAIKKATSEKKLASSLQTGIRDGAKDMGVKPSAITKLYGDKGAMGKRVLSGFDENGKGGGLGVGFAKSELKKGADVFKDQVKKPGKIVGNINNVTKAGKSGNLGEDQTVDETNEDLDF